MSDLLKIILTSGVIATFFTAKFNEKNSIHSESEWRKDLFNLSKRDCLSREDIELFRTCVSALRGTVNHDGIDKYDPYYLGQGLNKRIDDICIVYYYYLINLLLSNGFNYVSSYNGCFPYVISDNENDVLVFRQLCRLLVKADWNKRTKSSILNCQYNVYKETDEKALLVVGRHLKTREGRLQNVKSRIKRQSYRLIKKDYKRILKRQNISFNDPNDFRYKNLKKNKRISKKTKNNKKSLIIKSLYILISIYLFINFTSNYLIWKNLDKNIDILKQVSKAYIICKPYFVFLLENLSNIISILIFIIIFLLGFYKIQKLMFPYNK